MKEHKHNKESFMLLACTLILKPCGTYTNKTLIKVIVLIMEIDDYLAR